MRNIFPLALFLLVILTGPVRSQDKLAFVIEHAQLKRSASDTAHAIAAPGQMFQRLSAPGSDPVMVKFRGVKLMLPATAVKESAAEAIEAFEDKLNAATKAAEIIRYTAALTLAELNKPRDVSKQAELEAMVKSSRDPFATSVLGLVHLRNHKHGDAETVLQQARSRNAEDASAPLNMGAAQLSAGKLTEAEASFRQAKTQGPFGWEAPRVNLAITYMMQGLTAVPSQQQEFIELAEKELDRIKLAEKELENINSPAAEICRALKNLPAFHLALAEPEFLEKITDAKEAFEALSTKYPTRDDLKVNLAWLQVLETQSYPGDLNSIKGFDLWVKRIEFGKTYLTTKRRPNFPSDLGWLQVPTENVLKKVAEIQDRKAAEPAAQPVPPVQQPTTAVESDNNDSSGGSSDEAPTEVAPSSDADSDNAPTL